MVRYFSWYVVISNCRLYDFVRLFYFWILFRCWIEDIFPKTCVIQCEYHFLWPLFWGSFPFRAIRWCCRRICVHWIDSVGDRGWKSQTLRYVDRVEEHRPRWYTGWYGFGYPRGTFTCWWNKQDSVFYSRTRNMMHSYTEVYWRDTQRFFFGFFWFLVLLLFSAELKRSNKK